MSDKEKKTIKQEAKVWFDEENKIMNAYFGSEVDMTTVGELIRGATSTLKENNVTDYSGLVDVSKLTKPIVSSRLRKQMYEDAKQVLVNANKVAIVTGTNILVKMAAKFVFAAVGKDEVEFFPTKEKALEWLKED